MKKVFLTTAVLLFFTAGLFAQAVKDRQVIPVSVNLNQVLRMTVTNGGNIEFVFNTIDEYRDGLSADAATSSSANPTTTDDFYQTDFTVASSTRWKVTYGSEQATFIGTDDPANTLSLDNVGFTLVNLGTHTFEGTGAAKATTPGASLFSTPTDNANEVAALQVYPVDLIEDNDDVNIANAGDGTENDFSLLWRCGTSEAGSVAPMNTASLLNQSVAPDRYVTNVIFELAVDN